MAASEINTATVPSATIVAFPAVSDRPVRAIDGASKGAEAIKFPLNAKAERAKRARRAARVYALMAMGASAAQQARFQAMPEWLLLEIGELFSAETRAWLDAV